jgi:hypothetical protein
MTNKLRTYLGSSILNSKYGIIGTYRHMKIKAGLKELSHGKALNLPISRLIMNQVLMTTLDLNLKMVTIKSI